LLIVIPFMLVGIGALFLEYSAPVYAGPLGYDQDPAYVYLLNGLSMLAGHAPGHIDHPGTPLQLLVAAFIPVWAVLTSPDAFDSGLINSVLADPEHYIHGISLALLLTNALCFMYAGARIFAATGSIFLAVVFQSTPLMFPEVFPRIFYLSPEAFLYAISAVTVGVLSPQIFNSAHCTGADSNGGKLSGITLGIGIATKVTFIPLLGLLLVFRGWRKIVRPLLYCTVTFLIAISPIWTQIPRLVSWLLGVFLHTEHYGRGSAGIIDLSLVPGRLVALIDVFPLYFAIVAVLIAVPVFSCLVRLAVRLCNRMECTRFPVASLDRLASGADRTVPARVSFVFVLVLAAQTVIVLKHFGQHYMVPALPVAAVAFVWLVRGAGALMAPPLRTGAFALILAFLVVSNAAALTDLHAAWVSDRSAKNQEHEIVYKEVSRYPDPIVVGGYRCNLQQCALDFGFGYTRGFNIRFAPAHLKNFYSFNIWNRKLFSYAQPTFGWTELEVIDTWLAEGRTILLVSPPYEELDVFETQLLGEGGSGGWSPVSVYRITGIRQ